jgi:hypothetical protein
VLVQELEETRRAAERLAEEGRAERSRTPAISAHIRSLQSQLTSPCNLSSHLPAISAHISLQSQLTSPCNQAWATSQRHQQHRTGSTASAASAKQPVQRAQLAHSHCRHHISNTNEMLMEHRMRSEPFGYKQAHRSKKARPAAQITPAASAT